MPAAFPWRVRDDVYGLDTTGEVVRLLVLMLAVGLFIHLAARVVIDRSSLAEALLSAVLGILGSILVERLVTVELLGFLLGLAAFAAITALIYRVKWLKGAAIGALAWVLWYVALLVFDWVLQQAD